jgi:hypothetical protein
MQVRIPTCICLKLIEVEIAALQLPEMMMDGEKFVKGDVLPMGGQDMKEMITYEVNEKI